MAKAPKWRKMCPFAQRTPFGGTEYDEDYGAEMRSNFPCVEDDCMAWRWNGAPAAQGTGYCAIIGRGG